MMSKSKSASRKPAASKCAAVLQDPDLLGIVLHFLVARIGELPPVRLTCKAWAATVDDRVRGTRRYCSTYRDYPRSETLHRRLFSRDGGADGWLVQHGENLLSAPPSLAEMSRWYSMSAMLGGLQVYELDDLSCLVPSERGTWRNGTAEELFLLLDALALLPALEVLRIAATETRAFDWKATGGEYDFSESGYDGYLATLRKKLGKLKGVHTTGGFFGFDEPNCLQLFGCLKDMPALRHVEFNNFIDAYEQGHPPAYFEECVGDLNSLTALNLASVGPIGWPSRRFWNEFRKGKHEALTELSVVLNDDGGVQDTSRLIADVIGTVIALPSLRTFRWHFYEDTEMFHDEYDDAGNPGKGNEELRKCLLSDLREGPPKGRGGRRDGTDDVREVGPHEEGARGGSGLGVRAGRNRPGHRRAGAGALRRVRGLGSFGQACHVSPVGVSLVQVWVPLAAPAARPREVAMWGGQQNEWPARQQTQTPVDQ